MDILPKAVYRLNAIPIKVPMALFNEPQQRILKALWKRKRPQMARAILKKYKAGVSSSLTSIHTT